VVGSLKHGNEPSGSIKDEEIFDWLSDSFSGRTPFHEVNE
jgi:hypothetical protein